MRNHSTTQPPSRKKNTRWRSLAMLLAPLVIQQPILGQVEVNVSRIGYPAVREGDIVRCGDWTPIVVDVALTNQAAFDGVVRVGERDIDGDEFYDEVEIHLRRETGGSRRVNLYIPANPAEGNAQYNAVLFDDAGEAVDVVCQGALARSARPAQQPTVIDDDDYLVVSTSSGTISRVKELVEETQLRLPFVRNVHVAHVAASELPELWIGLEMVDAMVWDQANPDDLDQRQLAALGEWVRRGGTLLIAASRTANALHQAHEIDKLLPVDTADITSVSNLRGIRENLIGPPTSQEKTRVASDWIEQGFPQPVPVVECTLRDGAVAIGLENVDLKNALVLAARPVGQGRVIYSAVTMRDLFSAKGDAGRFFGDLFHLTSRNAKEDLSYQPTSIFGRVAGAVSFNTRASLYLLIAGIISVAYIVVATLGSWSFLSVRGWRKQSWSTFALVATTASVLSVIGVNTMRGWGESLHQLTIVDGQSGSRSGSATVLFGLRTSVDKHLDVWLPADPNSAVEPHATNCALKPLPGAASTVTLHTSFSDPQSYRVQPSDAVIEGVRLRGTLKQFEGRWDGVLEGTIDAHIVVEGLRIRPESYIVSHLGVELTDCLLLQAGREIEQNAFSRSGLIFALELGSIPGDGQKISIADRAYGLNTDNINSLIQQAGLDKAQANWVDWLSVFNAFKLRSKPSHYIRGEEKTALLLYSTIDEFDPATMPATAVYGRGQQRATLSRDRFRQLDVREWLIAGQPARVDEPARTGSMVLIGFTKDPGPARLFAREGNSPYHLVEPEAGQSLTMYRFRIPVEHRERTVKQSAHDPADRTNPGDS